MFKGGHLDIRIPHVMLGIWSPLKSIYFQSIHMLSSLSCSPSAIWLQPALLSRSLHRSPWMSEQAHWPDKPKPIFLGLLMPFSSTVSCFRMLMPLFLEVLFPWVMLFISVSLCSYPPKDSLYSHLNSGYSGHALIPSTLLFSLIPFSWNPPASTLYPPPSTLLDSMGAAGGSLGSLTPVVKVRKGGPLFASPTHASSLRGAPWVGGQVAWLNLGFHSQPLHPTPGRGSINTYHCRCVPCHWGHMALGQDGTWMGGDTAEHTFLSLP